MAGPPSTARVDTLYLSFQAAVAGRYSIDRELGRGGMGVVYLAREVHLDRLVAIKLLPPDRSGDALVRERFLREARLAAKLSHPNIIPIHAVDEVSGFVYYVMTYVDGETLSERVRSRGPLAGTECGRVMRDVAWALAHAHGQGLVHRDVKPDNVLIEHASKRVLVADFGIAAVRGDDGVAVCGTPEFMSPEQALGSTVDSRSDIYSLGVTAYFACTGQLPFEGASPSEVLAKQVTVPAPRVGSRGTGVPRRLAQLIDRCLAKDPNQRPASGEEVAELVGVATERRRELPAALRAFVKRNGRMDGGGTMLVGLLLLGAGAGVGTVSGVSTGVEAFVAGVLIAPFIYMVAAARSISLLGFTHADIGPAFRAEAEQAREEHAVEPRRGFVAIERVIGALAAVAWVASIAGAVLSLAAVDRVDAGAFAIFSRIPEFAFPAALVTTVSYVALVQRRRDIDTDFWMKVWNGRAGRLAFAIARRLIGRGALPQPSTHRATELSLGLAAEQLFESLPRETQRALGDLPDVLRRLQRDAQRLRRRVEDYGDAIATSRHPGSPHDAELRSVRDASRAKLADAVGALETIRLNLLRLHAGAFTVDGLTTYLGLAAEVSADVERLLAAHDDVKRGLGEGR